MTAYTPGPLIVSHWPDESGQYPGWHIDKPTGPDGGEPVAMVWEEEDALLYAAAPETAAQRDRLREKNHDLLEALGRVEDCLQDIWAQILSQDEPNPEDRCSREDLMALCDEGLWPETREAVRAAIAKAKTTMEADV